MRTEIWLTLRNHQMESLPEPLLIGYYSGWAVCKMISLINESSEYHYDTITKIYAI